MKHLVHLNFLGFNKFSKVFVINVLKMALHYLCSFLHDVSWFWLLWSWPIVLLYVLWLWHLGLVPGWRPLGWGAGWGLWGATWGALLTCNTQLILLTKHLGLVTGWWPLWLGQAGGCGRPLLTCNTQLMMQTKQEKSIHYMHYTCAMLWEVTPNMAPHHPPPPTSLCYKYGRNLRWTPENHSQCNLAEILHSQMSIILLML